MYFAALDLSEKRDTYWLQDEVHRVGLSFSSQGSKTSWFSRQELVEEYCDHVFASLFQASQGRGHRVSSPLISSGRVSAGPEESAIFSNSPVVCRAAFP